MPLVTEKVLPMSPVHLLPMSPVYTLPRDGGDVRGGYLDSSLVAAFAALGSLSLNQQPLQRLDSQKPKWEASLRDWLL